MSFHKNHNQNTEVTINNASVEQNGFVIDGNLNQQGSANAGGFQFAPNTGGLQVNIEHFPFFI